MESPYTEFGRFNPNQHQGHYWNTGAAASTMRTSSSTLRGRPGVGPANTTPRRQKSEAPLGKKRGLDNSGASIVGSPGPSMGGASHWGNGFGAAHGDEHKEAYQYGYTPEGWDVHLDTAKAEELVKACGEEIRARGE